MANVLIIDDDASLCIMLSKLVRRMGHEAVCRHTLIDGLQAALSAPCDVVLLDVHVPDGSGLEILPDIRKIDSPPPRLLS